MLDHWMLLTSDVLLPQPYPEFSCYSYSNICENEPLTSSFLDFLSPSFRGVRFGMEDMVARETVMSRAKAMGRSFIELPRGNGSAIHPPTQVA